MSKHDLTLITDEKTGAIRYIDAAGNDVMHFTKDQAKGLTTKAQLLNFGIVLDATEAEKADAVDPENLNDPNGDVSLDFDLMNDDEEFPWHSTVKTTTNDVVAEIRTSQSLPINEETD